MKHATCSRGRKAGAFTALLGIAASMLVLLAPSAHAAAPVIVNGASANQWLESFSVPKDTNGERIHLTLIVRHDLGTQVTGLAVDDDWNGTDNTLSLGVEGGGAVTVLPGGDSNHSAIRYSFIPSNMSFSCGFFSGTRRLDNTLRVRAVLSNGQRTGVVSSNVHSVENGQCAAVTDYPYLRDQSQSASSVTPGSTVTFTFQGDDVDSSGANDSLDKLRWRVRRLADGAIVQGPTNVGGLSDNTNINLNVTFPQRGRYVVEADLGGEDDGFGDFENATEFFRIGAVDVNSAAGAHSLSLSPSSPVVDDGGTATVTASFTDPDVGGRAQMIRWDADNNGTFERRELADDEAAGLTTAERQQSISPTHGSCADRVVRAEVTDNGAMNGADAIRRVVTASTTIVVNCAPTANSGGAVTNEDTPVAITLGASDPDGDALTYSILTSPSHGSLSGGTGAARTYSPNGNFHGTDSFTFRVTDVHGRQSGPVTVSITVLPVNDAPVAADRSVATDEDTPLVVDLSGAISDVDGDTLTIGVASAPANGSAVVTGPQEITYSPDADYHGADSLLYSVSDGNGGTDTAALNVSVDPQDDVPVAADQSVTTDEGTAITVNLGPTVDADGEAVTYTVATQPANGTVVVAGNEATYTPSPDFNGSDSFIFTASDGTSSPMGTVSVTVAPVNDAPVADDQAVLTDEDTPAVITLTGSDVDGDPLDFTVTSGPLHGRLDTTTGPTVVYTPDANYFGPDAFTFVVGDGQGGADTGTVSITVAPVNDPPVADDEEVTTDEDTPVGILLTASDVDGDDLTFTVSGNPSHGTLTGTAPNLVYTPALNHVGDDSLSFTVEDGNGGADTAVVTIHVQPVNDAPSAVPQSVVTGEDTPVSITLEGTDVDDTDLSFAVVAAPANGSLSGTAPDLVYTPAADFNGDDGFTFSVTDAGGLSATATVFLSVGPVNDNPVAGDQQVTTSEDTPLAVTLAATDVDGDELAYSIEVAPVHGTAAIYGATVVYTPSLNFHGTDSFVFRVEDGDGVDFGTADLTVVPVNDAPDAAPQTVLVPEDTATPIDLVATDVDGDALTIAVTSSPAHGTLSGTAPNLVYTPAADYTGPDSFTFSATDPSGATDTATVTIDVQAAPLIATTLVAEPAFVSLGSTGLVVRIGDLVAHLTDTETGGAVAGAPITFTAGGTTLCTAVTNSSGTARCGTIVTSATVLLNSGFHAFYAGDPDRRPASATGPLIRV